MSETPDEALKRRTEYIGQHALEGEFDDIVKCMVEERRVTLEECAAIVSNPAAHLSNATWGIKQLLKELDPPGGIVFSTTAPESEIQAIIDSDGNARLYPNRKPNTEGELE